MKKRPFREHHILQLFEDYDEQGVPLDLFISNYFRAHKSLGSKDRAEISETIYGMVRWKGLLDHLCGKPITWEKRLSLFKKFNPSDYQEDTNIPIHIRLSFPKILFDLIKASHGEQKGCDLCLVSNSAAPTTVRINPLKTTRKEMLDRWKNEYDVIPCQFSEHGIIFLKKINFFCLTEFKEGFFEVQDEGSQLLAELVQAQPGEQVMDYCAGSGGKTLAFAHKMQHTGQIYLHDIRPRILLEAKKRLRRAGIQNTQIVKSDRKKLKKKMDWILVDAPCTGTGTYRRNPDMKWKFTNEMLVRLIGQQRMIFEKALSFMKPEGRIVYGTCSILKEENHEQVDHFINTYNLKLDGEPFQSFPSERGMDGFFGIVLKR